MMRRTYALIVMVVLVAAWTLPVLAQTGSTAPAQTPAPKPAAPAAKPEPAKPAAPKAKTAAGTVKSVAADSLVLVTGKDKKELTFGLTKDTKVTRDGKTAEAAKLAENDSATVTYTEAEGKMTAQKVTAKAPKAAKAETKPKS